MKKRPVRACTARQKSLTRPQRCCSSEVEHSLGKGEVESSILSSSTIPTNWIFTRSVPAQRSALLDLRVPARNGSGMVDLPFDRDEYDARLAKTRAAMERDGLELLILSDPSNMNWLTGYDGWSFYVHQCVVVPLGDDPLWLGRSQDANGAQRTCWLPEDRILGRRPSILPPAARRAGSRSACPA